MIARIKDFVQTRGGESIITFVTRAECAEEIDELKDADVDVKLKKYRRKRSLDANAYAWVLIDKIAAVNGYRPEEVYRTEIMHIAGVSDVVGVRKDAVKAFCNGWQSKGIGWMAKELPSTSDKWTNVKVWYGSSTYDTKQMSELIDNLIQDAKSLGITTETPDEIARIKSLWGNER